MSLKAQLLLFCILIFAVFTSFSAAQSESSPSVVNASEILGKIERGETVFYTDKIIEGDISVADLDLDEIRNAKSEFSEPEMFSLGLSKNTKLVRSQISLKYCVVKGDLDFSNVLIHEPISLLGSTMLERVDFNGSRFNQYAEFKAARFNRSAYFLWSQFNSSADFQWSQFNQNADFSMSRFNQNADFSESQFNQNADFSESQFNQNADFSESQFNQNADFSGSQFNQSANFMRSQFNLSAYFQYSQFNQKTYFIRSRFNQNADFSMSQFNQNADFSMSRFNQNASFSMSRFNQSASFIGSRFDQNADFIVSQFQSDAYFSMSSQNFADFNHAKFSGDLFLEGSKIDHLNLTRTKFGKIFLRWESIGRLAYDETAYLLLAGNFKGLNFLEDANECYYDYRNDRRDTLKGIKWAVDYLLMIFYGYGVKPDRPVLWSLFFMSLFALLFWWRQGILPVRQGEPKAEAAHFTLPEAVAFSSMILLSGGKLVFDPPKHRIASGKSWLDVRFCKALFVGERLMGMMLLLMFGIAVTKTIILGS